MNPPVAASTFAPAPRQEKALRSLLLFWLTTCIAAIGLGLLTVVLLSLVPPNRVDESFLAHFTVIKFYFYPGQPAKDLAFEIGSLLTPFFVMASYSLSQALLRILKPTLLPLAARLAIGATWLTFMFCLFPAVYESNPPSVELAPGRLLLKWYWMASPLPWWAHFVGFSLGMALYFYFWKRNPTQQQLNVAMVILFLLWILLIPISFYSPADFNDDLRYTYHFNAVTDALSQVINGHHLLVQFPHIYGGYIEILGPLLAILPRRLQTLMDVFPLLNAMAVLGLLVTARLVIRQSLFLLLTGAALLAIIYMTSSVDHYYAYTPIRLLFPAWGLAASALYFRRPEPLKYSFVSLVAAIGTVWNLDTGFALWLSWTATLLVVGLSEDGWRQAGKNFAAQLTCLVSIWIAFILYLRLASGLWPDLQMLFVFQRLVLGSGYMCLPMAFPDAWVVNLLIYLAALVVTAIFYLQRMSSWKTHFVLMLSFLGIGIYHYFMGRSAESNLIAVSYPILLLIGILLCETRSMISIGRLPGMTWAAVLPATLILCWWALLLPTALPSLVLQSAVTVQKLRLAIPNPLETNAAFITRFTTPKEGVYLLSNQSGVYYYLSDTVRPIPIPGTVELLLTKDMNRLISAIAEERFKKLFVDQNFFAVNMYKPEIYAHLQTLISQHYQAQETSPTGQVTLYLPR